MGVLRWFSQVWTVTLLNLRTLGQRRGSSAATVFGVAGVVMVFVGVLSIAQGFKATLAATASPDGVIVLRGGSNSEMMSGLTRDVARIIADAPGVARIGGSPAASAEMFVVVDLPKRSTGTAANVPLRGVQPAAYQVHKDVHIVAGRPELRVEASDLLQHGPPERHVAAGNVLGLAVRDEQVRRAAGSLRDALRDEPIRRRHVRSTHRRVRGGHERCCKVGEPVAIGNAVVVHVGDDLAVCSA